MMTIALGIFMTSALVYAVARSAYLLLGPEEEELTLPHIESQLPGGPNGLLAGNIRRRNLYYGRS